MLLSPHFSLAEMTRSQTAERLGLDNTPTPEAVEALAALCRLVLEPLRIILGVPIHVDSGYRSPAVNSAVGGAKTSAHLSGRAADIVPVGMSLDRAYTILKGGYLQLDQVIREFPPGGWIHVSIAAAGQVPRRQFLIAERVGGATQYRPG